MGQYIQMLINTWKIYKYLEKETEELWVDSAEIAALLGPRS